MGAALHRPQTVGASLPSMNAKPSIGANCSRSYALLRVMVFAVVLMTPAFCMADLANALARFTGYTIVAVKTIAGYVDKNGKKSDDFEGCDYDRRIVFDDSTSLTCSSYGYQYAYRPHAVILMKSTQM